jgi:hypothetical protein
VPSRIDAVVQRAARAVNVVCELRGTLDQSPHYDLQSRTGIMAQKSFKQGDKVEWESSGGHSVGKVVRKVTSPITIKGHKVAASKSNPEFLVESDKSGNQAAHKPDSLKRV